MSGNDEDDTVYKTAIALAEDVTTMIRRLASRPNPLHRILTDLLMESGSDVALVADAYEAAQEARIFHGPPNGSGK